MILKHLKYQLLSNMWCCRVRRKFILPASKVVPSGGVFCEKKTKCRILSISSPAEIKLLPAMTAFNPLMHNVPEWSDTL